MLDTIKKIVTRYRKYKLRSAYRYGLEFAFNIYYYDKVSHSYKVTRVRNRIKDMVATKRITKKEYLQG